MTAAAASTMPDPPPPPGGAVGRLAGGTYLTVLDRHLKRLRRAYAHGNRTFFYDDLVTCYLLAFFNPTLRSLRTIEDVGRLPQAAAYLGAGRRACRSTLSDATALMDARPLEPVIDDLRRRIPDLAQRDAGLGRLLGQVQAADGSFFAAAADVAGAIAKRHAAKDKGKGKGKGKGKDAGAPREPAGAFKVRLDLRLDGRGLPRRLSVGGTECTEPDAAAQAIEPGAIYVIDRGYVDFTYVDAVLAGAADLVLRLKQDTNFGAREEQPLDEQDRAAGVLADRIGELTGSPHTWRLLPHQQLREVVVFDPAHPDTPIRLLTSLLDVPARVIALLYRWRWQIELFFRWLKVHAHFRHLISHSRNGMTLGFYVAVIAVLLIYLHTGRPVSKYAYTLLAAVAAGWGTVADILPILEARETERARDRQRQARKRAGQTHSK